MKYTTIENDFIRRSVTKRQNRLKLKWSLSKVSDFPGQDQTNLYYRFVHLAEDKELSPMPANLRMNGLRGHGISQSDFELFALAVSAVNGCGLCITSHLQQLIKEGISRAAIQASIRLAATLSAAAQALAIVESESL